MRRAIAALLLAALVGPSAARAEWVCPLDGRLQVAKAPAEHTDAPDAACLAGGLVYFVGPDGEPFAQTTRVGPGVFFTGAAYENLAKAFKKRGDVALSAMDRPVPCPEMAAVPTPTSGWSGTALLISGFVGLLVGGFAAYKLAK